MRRIVRMVAAGIVVILGLALVSVAAFSSDIAKVTLPEAPATAPGTGGKGVVQPLDPNVDNGPIRKIKVATPDVFATEFGKRGKHEVTVSMSGPAYYQVQWRGGKVENGAGVYNRTKTVKGGFPLALITINAGARSVSCTITIDGVKKDTQTTNQDGSPIVFCEG